MLYYVIYLYMNYTGGYTNCFFLTGSTRRIWASWTAGLAWSSCKLLFGSFLFCFVCFSNLISFIFVCCLSCLSSYRSFSCFLGHLAHAGRRSKNLFSQPGFRQENISFALLVFIFYSLLSHQQAAEHSTQMPERAKMF